jgi:hypothetical protein
VTPDNAGSVPEDAPADYRSETATHGLVLLRVGAVELTDLTATGFSRFGVLTVDSEVDWVGGGASSNLRTGIMALGGSFTADNIAANDTLRGAGETPARGVAFGEDVLVETSQMEVSRNQGYGVLHSGVTASHSELVASSNAEPAVWAQDCARFGLDESAMVDNAVAGVVLLRVGGGRIDDSNVGRTVLESRRFGDLDVEVGDGMHVVEPTGRFRFEDTTLADNGRVGLLIDLAGVPYADAVEWLSSIDVEGRDEQYGVLVQGGEVPDGWDAGVSRAGSPAMNDPAFSGSLPVVSALDLGFISTGSAAGDAGIEGITGPL